MLLPDTPHMLPVTLIPKRKGARALSWAVSFQGPWVHTLAVL